MLKVKAGDAERFAREFFRGKGPEVEVMYQAFKARLICELGVRGGSNEGVVYGRLEPRDDLKLGDK